MTTTNTDPRTSATGTGAEQVVAFTFPIVANGDITVIQRVTATGVETALSETTHYTVTNNGSLGGSITTVTPFVATTAQIHIFRNTANTQTLDLVAGGSFSAENIEAALDRNSRLIQENVDAIERCLRLPDTDADSLDTTLDNAIDRASKNLTFDASGNVAASDSVATGSVSFTQIGEDVVGAADSAAVKRVLDMPETIDAQDYNTLALAVTAAANSTLVISTNISVAADTTVPATVSLEFRHDGLLTVAATKTVTINGSITAGLTQIFDTTAATSAIAFGETGLVSDVWCQWWGALPSASAAVNTAAIQDCFDQVHATRDRVINVHICNGDYTISDTIALTGSLDGDGFSLNGHETAAIIQETNAKNGLKFDTFAGLVIKDIRIIGDTSATGNGLWLLSNRAAKIDNVYLKGFSHALHSENGVLNTYNNISGNGALYGSSYSVTASKFHVYLDTCTWPTFNQIDITSSSETGFYAQDCVSVNIESGAVQSVGAAVADKEGLILKDSIKCTLTSMDFENNNDNTDPDVVIDGGYGNVLNNISASFLHLTGNTFRNKINEGAYDDITIDSGCWINAFYDTAYNKSAGGTLTDNGSRTIFWNCRTGVSTPTSIDAVTNKIPITGGFALSGHKPTSSSGTLTLECDDYNIHYVLMAENITSVVLNNPVQEGQEITIVFRQTTTSAYTVTGWPATVRLTGGLFIPSSGSSAVASSISFVWNSSNWFETSRCYNICAAGANASTDTITNTVEITNAQIKALTTPKELVPAQGSNKLIEFVSLVLILDYGSEVLAEPSAPDDLAVEYDDGSGTQVATWDTTGFITNNANAMEIIHGASVGGGASAIGTSTNVNKNLVLINTGGNYTGNATADTTMTAKVTYRVHDIDL